jgi:pilus assembly protein CpaF
MGTLKDQIARWNHSSRRVVAPPLLEPTTTEAQASPASPLIANAASGVDYYLTKMKVHQKLLTRIDLDSIENLTPEQLRNELGFLLVALIEEDAIPLNNQERTRLVTDLKNEIMGLGPLEPLLADLAVSEIMVNGYQSVYIEKNGCIELTDIRFNDNAHLMKIIDKIVSRVGRRIDESNPMVDARLPDGSRVNAIIPPLALDGPVLTIRRFSVVPLLMPDLIQKKTITPAMAELLSALVKVKCNIIISGGTGTGKTTLLNILSSYIPSNERIVTIEDTAELQLQQNHVIRLETRPPNIEGKGEITMHNLVINSLRMRPNRIVLGEVRSSEAIEMLFAMNTGHEGSLTTIHANSPRQVLERLENLLAMSGTSLPSKSLRQLISSTINFIVQITRQEDGSRKIVSIQEICGMEGDVITIQEIFYYKRTGINPDGTIEGIFNATGVCPNVYEKMSSYGIELSDGMFDTDVYD